MLTENLHQGEEDYSLKKACIVAKLCDKNNKGELSSPLLFIRHV